MVQLQMSIYKNILVSVIMVFFSVDILMLCNSVLSDCVKPFFDPCWIVEFLFILNKWVLFIFISFFFEQKTLFILNNWVGPLQKALHRSCQPQRLKRRQVLFQNIFRIQKWNSLAFV